MSFAEALVRQQEAIFARLGEDATWAGVTGTVRVRRREHDEESRFDQASEVLTVRAILVRRSEVRTPADGNEVQILDDAGEAVPDALYVVDGEPEMDRRGVWRCAVKLA
jgi:hypothetical protein